MSRESQVSVIILAAGQGTRMKSDLSKVLFTICGRPMLHYVLDAASSLEPHLIAVVIGHQGREVQASVEEKWAAGRPSSAGRAELGFAWQKQRKGTAHAVMSAQPLFASEKLLEGDTLILYGDVPLLSGEILKGFLEEHREEKADLSLMTFMAEDPGLYGRVIRDSSGAVAKIVEARDLQGHEKNVKEVNAGIYLVRSQLLFDLAGQVDNNNAKGEYYLTDIVGMAVERGLRICTHECLEEAVQGINDRYALSTAEAVKRREILRELALSGVTVRDPDSVYVDYGVRVGEDCVLEPSTHLRGSTVIGPGCIIGPGTLVQDSEIGQGSAALFSVVERSRIGSHVTVGPYAHIRPDCVIGDGVLVGNFAEVKNTVIGKGSKVHHHCYLGDSTIGEGVNIGAGTVTVNYDGRHKHRTIMEDRAFIGCNANLIAPMRIGRGAYVAAGSTITSDVPDESLAIARERQITKEGWVRKKQQEWDQGR